MKRYILSFICICACIVAPWKIYSAGEKVEYPKDIIMEAKIDKVVEEKEILPQGAQKTQTYQKLEAIITSGLKKGDRITVENGAIPTANTIIFRPGDRVVITLSHTNTGESSAYISDYVRRGSLFTLFLIFIFFSIVIAGWKGIFSLIGMGFSFLVILLYILPTISKGSDPIRTAIIGSMMIIPITFFMSHGINRKTIIAIAGTTFSLVVTGILADIFVKSARLTGFASEEAGFLQIAKFGSMNMEGILLAGIIIGVLGVLDDITISQSAIVFQLKDTDNSLGFKTIYAKAMSVGRDHIASMVNTLILVYTGAALPLLLLFVDNPRPFSELINYEIIADEIVRTLVGSIGLVLAVPITTLLAAYATTVQKKEVRV